MASARPSRRGLLLTLGMGAALAACGRKGELELPPVENPTAGDDLTGGGIGSGDDGSGDIQGDGFR